MKICEFCNKTPENCNCSCCESECIGESEVIMSKGRIIGQDAGGYPIYENEFGLPVSSPKCF